MKRSPENNYPQPGNGQTSPIANVDSQRNDALNHRASGPFQNNDVETPGESDPFVNLLETSETQIVMPGEASNRPPSLSSFTRSQEVDEILDRLSDCCLPDFEASGEIPGSPTGSLPPPPVFRPAFALLRGNEAPFESPEEFHEILGSLEHVIEEGVIQPTVEVIESSQEELADNGCLPTESDRCHVRPTIENYSFIASANPTLNLDDTDSLAAERNEPDLRSEPLTHHIPNSGYSIPPFFDIRDFRDANDGVIDPIPGAYDFAPDTFDHKTADQLAAEIRANHELRLTEQKETLRDQDEVFLAHSGDVIKINGDDGFDHIDLRMFKVEDAVFLDQIIKIDNRKDSVFEIHYRDIQFALFAGDVKVTLGGESCQDHSSD